MIKNLPANAGDTRDMGSIPESGKSPGERHSNPFQKWRSTPVFLPGSPMDKRTQWATVHGVAKPLNNTKHTAHTRTHTHTHTRSVRWVSLVYQGEDWGLGAPI